MNWLYIRDFRFYSSFFIPPSLSLFSPCNHLRAVAFSALIIVSSETQQPSNNWLTRCLNTRSERTTQVQESVCVPVCVLDSVCWIWKKVQVPLWSWWQRQINHYYKSYVRPCISPSLLLYIAGKKTWKFAVIIKQWESTHNILWSDSDVCIQWTLSHLAMGEKSWLANQIMPYGHMTMLTWRL